MTREEARDLALSQIDHTKYMVLELITSFGKSKLAIDLVNHICDRVFKEEGLSTTVLILVAKTVHKQTWRDEIVKWGGLNTDHIKIECYESLHKYKNTHIDVIICDEMQHLSNNRLDILNSMCIEEAFIGLSATIKKDMKELFIRSYNACVISCGLKDAVSSNVLPEPTVYLLPLTLDSIKYTYKTKKFKKNIITTQSGYYDTMSSLINWYKNKYLSSRNERMKNLWLSTAGKRLKWLSEQKHTLVLSLLDKFKNHKVLTFCSSIEQAEILGRYNITSKNSKSIDNLNKFNSNKIKHITAVNILNEGVNLVNCRIGIFCNLNSSEIITKQRIGRLLRHESPIVIVPYFKDTREEELMEKMLQEYSEDSVKIISNINEIKL